MFGRGPSYFKLEELEVYVVIMEGRLLHLRPSHPQTLPQLF
jgi:hypothetical protein